MCGCHVLCGDEDCDRRVLPYEFSGERSGGCDGEEVGRRARRGMDTRSGMCWAEFVRRIRTYTSVPAYRSSKRMPIQPILSQLTNHSWLSKQRALVHDSTGASASYQCAPRVLPLIELHCYHRFQRAVLCPESCQSCAILSCTEAQNNEASNSKLEIFVLFIFVSDQSSL